MNNVWLYGCYLTLQGHLYKTEGYYCQGCPRHTGSNEGYYCQGCPRHTGSNEGYYCTCTPGSNEGYYYQGTPYQMPPRHTGSFIARDVTPGLPKDIIARDVPVTPGARDVPVTPGVHITKVIIARDVPVTPGLTKVIIARDVPVTPGLLYLHRHKVKWLLFSTHFGYAFLFTEMESKNMTWYSKLNWKNKQK